MLPRQPSRRDSDGLVMSSCKTALSDFSDAPGEGGREGGRSAATARAAAVSADALHRQIGIHTRHRLENPRFSSNRARSGEPRRWVARERPAIRRVHCRSSRTIALDQERLQTVESFLTYAPLHRSAKSRTCEPPADIMMSSTAPAPQALIRCHSHPRQASCHGTNQTRPKSSCPSCADGALH